MLQSYIFIDHDNKNDDVPLHSEPLNDKRKRDNNDSSANKKKQKHKHNETQYPVVRFDNGVIEIISYKVQTIMFDDDVVVHYAQVPLTLSYALTIHKSQGMTLERAAIALDKSVFSAGQGYVALSRVKSLNGLYLYSFDPTSIKADEVVIAFYTALDN